MPAQRGEWALCVHNEGYEGSLRQRAFYQSIPDHDAKANGQLRVIDESGEEHLFPARCFAGTKPAFVGKPILATAAATGVVAGLAAGASMGSGGSHQNFIPALLLAGLGIVAMGVLVVGMLATVVGSSRTIGPLLSAAAFGVLIGVFLFFLSWS